MNVRHPLGAGLAGLLLLTGCAKVDDSPVPTRTRVPSLTSSSSEPTNERQTVCRLLTSDDRRALAGRSMNVVVPTARITGRQDCQWVHVLNGTTDSTIRLVLFRTGDWIRYFAPGLLHQALLNPRLSAAQVLKLQAQQRKLSRDPALLTDEQVCGLYTAATESARPDLRSDLVFTSFTGRLLTVNAVGCGDGFITMIGYGELGLQPSQSLDQALIDLRQTVQERAAKELGEGSRSEGSSKGADDAAATDEPTAKPTVEATRSAGADE